MKFPGSRRVRVIAGIAVGAAALTGGTLVVRSNHSASETRPVSAEPTSPTVAQPPHFATPEAAMRYLAAAWNANDLEKLRHVTNPAARAELNGMHAEATSLALDHCRKRPAGDYDCFFTHRFPSDRVRHREDKDGDGIGHAEFLVGPADRPGWYMTVYVGCGG